MFITTAESIRRIIEEIIESSEDNQPVCIAVAFWGDEAEILLPPEKRYRIICNLSTGGTNPSTIRKLMMYEQIEVKHLSSLHAKVIVGQHGSLIGSANFSNNAIGFKGIPIWQEADVFIPGTDTRFSETQEWFWHQWKSALKVRESDLYNAEIKWEARKKISEELAATPDNLFDSSELKHVLKEDDLFKPAITGGNKIRMASQAMETLFGLFEPSPDKTMIRIPAFVSNILWTFYGQAIATAIKARPEFQLPAHVWERALEPGQPKYNESKIRSFILFLSAHPESPSAIRFWAKNYLEKGSPGAP